MNWQLIILAILLVLVIFNFFAFFTRKKNLGDLLLAAPRGLRYADMGQLFMIGCSIFLLAILYFGQEHNDTTILIMLILALITLILIATFLVSAFSQKGIYTNGVYTNTGPIQYAAIDNYEIKRKEKRNESLITFTTSGGFLKSTPIIVIPLEDESEFRNLIKRYGRFKKNNKKKK